MAQKKTAKSKVGKTTTRRKRRTKKQIEEDKAKELSAKQEAKANADKKFLTREEVHQADTLSNEIENARLTMALKDQDIKNLELQAELLKRDINAAKIQQQDYSRAYEVKKRQMNVFVVEMDKKYTLPNGELAYKSSTGELIDTSTLV